MSIINHYFEVQEIRFGKVGRVEVFRGEPMAITHPRRTEQIIAYTGHQPNGEPVTFYGTAIKPEYRLIDLGELPDPKFEIGQKFDFPRNKKRWTREVVKITRRPDGWLYWGDGGERVSERRMSDKHQVTLID